MDIDAMYSLLSVPKHQHCKYYKKYKFSYKTYNYGYYEYNDALNNYRFNTKLVYPQTASSMFDGLYEYKIFNDITTDVSDIDIKLLNKHDVFRHSNTMKLISESYSYTPDLPDNPSIHIDLCYEWKYNDKYNIIFNKSYEYCAYHITNNYTLSVALPSFTGSAKDNIIARTNKPKLKSIITSLPDKPLSYRDAVIVR